MTTDHEVVRLRREVARLKEQIADLLPYMARLKEQIADLLPYRCPNPQCDCRFADAHDAVTHFLSHGTMDKYGMPVQPQPPPKTAATPLAIVKPPAGPQE